MITDLVSIYRVILTPAQLTARANLILNVSKIIHSKHSPHHIDQIKITLLTNNEINYLT